MQSERVDSAKHFVDPFLPEPAHLVKYLAYGADYLQLKTLTCATYRSVFLDTYAKTTFLTQDPMYPKSFEFYFDIDIGVGCRRFRRQNSYM
ncbi:hypothetical protein PHYBLDRAFT_141795 [Phycomyces blakesleeanus NRRL 1555(-)]|uniref:Uncharacterized protein n=1 Tax=Phycomyces blakesleeanus (strain ATCC 8743b / DSM 1359 / FGSC 10004 / NBRC 33097 / NRRL 1555) TaxID=763407 RepID=A0A167PHN3_PHYB8|nr:hypothetical protein PHYBLDRAFT_141795 [Phycomyces blakesleeanus NRRL 1555(-)]OAD77936.1 hypothetical protein PHYBLDRAFT_141795 [Phycomyces blakesleeanus NRRL 1555(-)]|eukprot:XP_018295976.1 hypothetical protein PHYBLDRAFT_141795 [Phycomyces blakesleeanus NRRL 1555(-)]